MTLQLQDINKRVKQMMSATNPPGQRSRLQQLELKASAEGFWEQQDKAAAVNQEMSDINELLDVTARMHSQMEDVQTAIELIDMEVHFALDPLTPSVDRCYAVKLLWPWLCPMRQE